MRSRFVGLRWLVFSLALSFCCTLPVLSQAPEPVTVTIETFFAPTPGAPNSIEVGWLREINAVEPGSIIRITLYNLTLPSVKDALLSAFDRGIEVRAIADKAALCNRGRPSALALELYNAGVSIKRYRNPMFPTDIMHNKYLIIDDRVLSTGSCNFTIQGTRYNHENMMLIKVVDGKTTFVEEYIRQFDRMWNSDFEFSGHEFVDWEPDPMDCQGVNDTEADTD